VGTARAVCDDSDVAEDHVFTADPFGALAIEQQKTDVVGEVLVADRDSHCGKDDVVGADDEVYVVDGGEQACGLAADLLADLQKRWNSESLESTPVRYC
jgi:hypothetical protein